MKHKIVFSILTLGLTLLALPVGAEELNSNVGGRARLGPNGARVEVRAQVEARRASSTESREDRREEVRNNIAERRASTTEHRMEIQLNIAKRKVEHVHKVILATIERLEKIILRIESRIDKIQERGGNTAEAEGFVDAAKGNLADAKVALEVFVSVELSGDTLAENFAIIRAAAAEAREHIQAAHQNLRNAIRSLKSVQINAEVQSSTEVQ